MARAPLWPRAGQIQAPPAPRQSAIAGHSDHPTIQPDRSGYIPAPEDFAAWMQHPVTRFVARAYQVLVEEQRAEWMRRTWDGETVALDPLLHKELTTRADTLRGFYESTYEDFVTRVQQGKPER